MKRCLLLLVALTGCSGGEARPPAPPSEPVTASGEPERIILQHVLISFEGSKAGKKRAKAEAEKLVADVVDRAKKGEDFTKLMKDFSEDPGPGIYRMSNAGIEPKASDEYARSQLVAGFGNVGFKLAVGEVGIAAYDPQASPYGWHVIKRLK